MEKLQLLFVCTLLLQLISENKLLWHTSVSSTLWRNSIHKLHSASNCFACWEAHVQRRIASMAPVLYVFMWPCIFSDTCMLHWNQIISFCAVNLNRSKRFYATIYPVFISSLSGTVREVGLCPLSFYRLYCYV